MKRYIIYINLLIFLLFSNSVLSLENNENKLYFFLAKKLFSEKQYIKAKYMFNKITFENNCYNKYSQKSKLYLILMRNRLKKYRFAKTCAKDFINMDKKSKYINHAYYL